MKIIYAETLEEIKVAIEQFERAAVYRGQTNHYGEIGSPSATTSFDRNGCVPSEMAKWIRYSESVLRHYFGEEQSTQEFCQAVLQHYGWHSFYLDASSSAAVSAWFASHCFERKLKFTISADHNEDPVFLKSLHAEYKRKEGSGHLYVLDREKIEKHIGLIDLSSLSVEGTRLRFLVQSAFLVGPLRNQPLPKECYLGHIIAPCHAFGALADESGLSETNDLFPSSKEDPVLRSLLALPWYELTEDEGNSSFIPVFRRSVELPEYQDGFVKHLSPSVGLYRGYSIAERGEIDGIKTASISIMVPNVTLFGRAPEMPMLFPKVEELLDKHTTVSFEVDTLVQHVTHENDVLYGKGISVAFKDGLYHLGELMIAHPGQQVTSAGVATGWYYKKSENGQWMRVPHEDECPCEDTFTHTRHLSMLTIVEEWLRDTSDF